MKLLLVRAGGTVSWARRDGSWRSQHGAPPVRRIEPPAYLRQQRLDRAGAGQMQQHPVFVLLDPHGNLEQSEDGIDSFVLARYGALLKPAAWTPPAPEARILQALLSRRDAIAQDLQRERNRQEKACATDTPDRIRKSIADSIGFLTKQLAELQQDIDDHIKGQVLARSLSFKGTRQLLLAFEQHLRFGAGSGVRAMTAKLLDAISLLTLPIRPGRVEPHAVKRRPKNHSLLTQPRNVARAAIRKSREVAA